MDRAEPPEDRPAPRHAAAAPDGAGAALLGRIALSAAGPLGARERELLADCAQAFEQAWAQHASVQAALAASEERLHLALAGSRLALWDLDVARGEVFLSEGWSLLLGGPPVPTRTTAAELLALVP